MYDAINILDALGLIHKDHKQLYFVGNDKINGVTLSLHRVYFVISHNAASQKKILQSKKQF
jgi:hypothetical protein